MLYELIVYPLFSCCIMGKFFIKKSHIPQDSSPTQDLLFKGTRIDLKNIHSNHRLRKISSYHPNNQDEIRKYYLQRDHCQLHKFE